MTAEQRSGTPELAVALGSLPRLTVHLVDLPDRQWVVSVPTLTVWIDKGSSAEQVCASMAEAADEILARREASSSNVVALGGEHVQAPLRLHSVPQ